MKSKELSNKLSSNDGKYCRLLDYVVTRGAGCWRDRVTAGRAGCCWDWMTIGKASY